MMSAGFQHESADQTKVSANIGLILAAVYAVLILLVYYAQTTTVRLEELNNQAAKVLNYQNGGLLFNYDLLGYGMMALSTFFMAETADDHPWSFLHQLLFHADDRDVYPYGCRQQRKRRGYRAFILVCVLFPDRPAGLQAFQCRQSSLNQP